MAQHKMKQKVQLPKGVKVKGRSKIQKHGPKKGQKLHIKPKKLQNPAEAKYNRLVTKAINEKNKQLISSRAN
ncbi:unnamed protein product [Soboliphyme baturini]|uniref:Leydig cell tumor 10 kDa protein homolog n=1 Tax=Soboliphyme baturini TaxID=241478 RepID=A0A183IW05_9BILA|nr:unnamed protein product [Soboliphyme baturini]